jgi:hypothetical protein
MSLFHTISSQMKSFLTAFRGSCFSFSFYREAAAGTLGRSLGYLVYLASLITVLMGTVLGVMLQRDLKPFLIEVARTFPECTIENGMMRPSVSAPYIVDRAGIAIAVLPGVSDTRVQEIAGGFKARSSFILTEKDLVVSESGRSTKIEWPRLVDSFGIRKLTGDNFRLILFFLYAAFIPGVIFFLAAFYLWNLLQAVYFTAFGYLYSRISEMRRPLSERTGVPEIFKISVYASTPAAILLVLVLAAVQLLYLPIALDTVQIIHMLMYTAFFVGGYHAFRGSMSGNTQQDTGEWDE